MARGLHLVLVFVALCESSAFALDPARHISQYAHASWLARDGFFSGIPEAVVQTQDGYVWVGTDSGLLRFDGVRFALWSPPSGRLPSPAIQALLAASDGSLWIGTRGGLSHWKNGSLTNYFMPAPGIASILEDRHGRIWFGLGLPQNGFGPLCYVLQSSARCLGRADRVPMFGSASGLTEDGHGDLWIGGDTTLLRWTPDSSTEYRPEALKHSGFQIGVTSAVPNPDGTLWVGFGRPGPGLGLQRFANSRWTSIQKPGFDSTTFSVSRLRLDRQGTLWIGTDHGLYRLTSDTVEHFDKAAGLSDDYVKGLSEDREGNLWVLTTLGVDRLTDTHVVSFAAAEGVCSKEVDTVAASRDGSVWIGGDQAISIIESGRVRCVRTGKGLPGFQVTSLLEDHDGRWWVGLDDTLWTYESGRFRKIRRADSSDIGFVSGLAEDAMGSIWVVAGPQPRKLLRIEGVVVREERGDLPLPRRVAADPTGGVWVGSLNGDLAHYGDGKVQTYRFAHDEAALLQQLLPDVDGSVLAATNYGLIGRHGGKSLTLAPANGLPCEAVNAIAFDRDHNLWLSMKCGLGILSNAELQRWKDVAGAHVSVKLLDTFDGVQTGEAPFVGGARSPDGRLWFATVVSAQLFDPTRQHPNAVPPPVHIEQVIADRRVYPGTEILRLPPLTRNLEIDYVGLSFVAPQKVFFRYRLDGRDRSWQEPGTRRQAFYNDLGPGRYHFRVIASNNDGLWNEEGAAVDILIEPAWYQTNAFVLLVVVTSIAMIWAVYRLRLRQVARALNTRFDERLAERTRVARDLHDTLLQTVQGSKMVADTALSRPDDAAGMREAMARVSTWLGQATTEGRAAVNALRSSTEETNDLAEAFRRAIEDCRRQGLAHTAVSVVGPPRDLHPVVRDEVFRIGYEAIRNGCAHANATRLVVTLTYSRDLIVRVADNGVGIEPAYASQGKDGHFGLQSMRERAERIGAQLIIAGTHGAGTEVQLTVPGRTVFTRTYRKTQA